MVETRPATLNRKLLGEFLKNPETIKAFENLSFNSEDLAAVVSAIQTISVLTLGPSDTFENERVVSSDGEIQLTDGGPGGSLTFGLSDSGVGAGVYGSASQTVQLSINQKGRITLAQAHALVTTNVAEGTNLYYTDARARSALSAGTGISYNSASGQISIASNAITDGLLRQSAAFSIIGRSGNTTGDVADITAAADGQVLRRSGSVLAFGALDLSSAGSVTGLLPVARGGTGVGTLTTNKTLKGNGTGAVLSGSITDNGFLVSIDSGVGLSIARTAVTSPVANDGNVYSGTYTPTLTGVTNIDAVTANVCQYMRVGNVVTVSGLIGIDATASGNYTFRISLPIPSNFTSAAQCNGCLTSLTGFGYARIISDSVNDVAQVDGSTSTTLNANASFTFTYQVI